MVKSIYNAEGAARYLGRSGSWGRLAFLNGRLPAEVYLNDRYPAVTEATLRKLAPKLKARTRKVH
jgi:hypothetical protein